MDLRSQTSPLLDSSPPREEPLGYYGARDVGFDGISASPMCGQAVLTNLLGKSPNKKHHRDHQPHYSPPTTNKSCLPPVLHGAARRRLYEDLAGPVRSPEDTESSSSASSSGVGAAAAAGAGGSEFGSSLNFNVVQFDSSAQDSMTSGAGDDGNTNPLSPSKNLLASFIGFKPTPWSSSLPAVTEEASSLGSEEHSHHEAMKMKKDTAESREATSRPTPSARNPHHSSPERNEMLAAMRSLVLKQQAALKEMVKENAKYRSKLCDFQSSIIKMRQKQVESEAKIKQLTLEKEAFKNEVQWLRDEIKTVGVAAAADAESDDDDTEVQRKLRDLMRGEPFSPNKSAEKAASDAFSTFKQSLLSSPPEEQRPGTQHTPFNTPSSPMSMAVRSLDYRRKDHSSSSAWVVESRDDEGTVLSSTSGRDTNASTTISNSRDESSAFSASWEDSVPSDEKKPPPPSTRKLNIAREEVTMFKNRLESIQRKRSERNTGRKQTNRTVRFETINT